MEATLDYKVEIEDLSGCKRRVRFEIPAATAAGEFDSTVRKYSKLARLPGFRPGKAPAGIIKNRYKNEIREEVTQELMGRAYRQMLQERDLKPLGNPHIESLEYEPGGPLRFGVELEVLPQFEAPDYRGLRYKQEPVMATDVEIDEALDKLRDRHATVVTVEDRAAEDGDFVHVDLAGSYPDEPGHNHPHEPFEEKDLVVALGDQNTHASFTENLRGVRPGESRSFAVAYAGDYPEKRIAGHTMSYTVVVKDIKNRRLPELNDEFARDVGDNQTLAELRDRIRAELQAAHSANEQASTRKQLLDQLVENLQVDVPDTLVEAELDSRIQSAAYNMAYRGVNPAKANIDWAKVRDQLRPEALHEAKAQMILSRVAENEKLDPSQEEIDQEIDRIAQRGGQPPEKVRQYFVKGERVESLRRDLRRRKAMELIYSSAQYEGQSTKD